MATNAPGTRADDESTEPRGWHLLLQHYSLVRTMSGHVREVAFLVAVLFTLYAAFHSSPLKTNKAPLPKPFFSKHSLVVDHFTGSVLKAFERMPDSDFTFIMYYAPWDAASMTVREDFEKIAKYHHDQVYFAAINCWWPEGECRQRFSKIHSFPVLIAYRRSGKGVQFHGKPTFPHLVRFLDHLIHPITPIHTRKDLLQLLVKHNVVMVGFFGFHDSPQPPGYSSFYIAAMKALEKDPDRTIGFAVISNVREAQKFGIKSNGTIHLYLWNSTLAFVHNGPLTSKVILDWVFKKKSEVVRWLSPPGAKSALLSGFLESSTTIMMLTPKFVTSSLTVSPFYYLFKEVALDYFKCNGSSQMDGVIVAVQQEFAEMAAVAQEPLPESCAHARDANGFSSTLNRCCRSVAIEDIERRTVGNNSVCEVCEVGCAGSNDRDDSLYRQISENRLWWSGCTEAMFRFRLFSVCCRSQWGASPSDPRNHPSVSTAGRYGCMLLRDGRVAPTVHVPSSKRNGRKLDGFSGLGCRTNKTLSFVAMDSLEYHVFFDKLGVDVLSDPSKTAVAIIQAEQESHFILNEPMTSETLRKFIVSYSAGRLRSHGRSARTTLLVPKPTEGRTAVQEIAGENFSKIVMDDSRDVVLLIYAPWCTFCTGMAHVFLSVARYFRSMTGAIRFVRIDGDANDLPWEFNVQKYPTIVFFPAHRKADSMQFASDIPITTTNLVHFVLLHTSEEIRLLAASNFCTSSCIVENRQLALQKISDLLRDYRLLDGYLRDVRNVLNDHCREGCAVKFDRASNYAEYARYLLREMCELRTQLSRVKTIHLMLSTVPNDRLTARQLHTILEDRQTLDGHFRTGCEDFLNISSAEFGACAGTLDPSRGNG